MRILEPADERLGDTPRGALERALDLTLAVILLLALAPLATLVVLLISLDSRGPILYRCHRVGRDGHMFEMLKFRKMHAGADGLPLTRRDDARFTRAGRLLAALKLDEIPQLVNVLRGQMSLVGPRPEDPSFVGLYSDEFRVLGVRPGITGLAQLAFARESDLLTGDDPIGYYTTRLLPAKLALDRLYCTQRSLRMYVRVLAWTLLATCIRRPVAVHRETGKLTIRRRRVRALASVAGIAATAVRIDGGR